MGDANNPNQIGFGDVLDFAKEEAVNTFTPYTEQQLAARDARRWNSLIQGETDQWKKPFDTGLNPLDFGNFTYVPELGSRVNMKTTLPGGNDFITKPWYDLSIYEKFGFLPKYEMPNVDAIEIFSGRSVPDVNQLAPLVTFTKRARNSHAIFSYPNISLALPSIHTTWTFRGVTIQTGTLVNRTVQMGPNLLTGSSPTVAIKSRSNHIHLH